MKKSILVMLALVLALGAMGVGVAFAQTDEPPAADATPVAPYGHGALRGALRVYKVEAFAVKLNLTVDEVNALLDGGTRLHQIALDNGVAEADLPTFMQEIHQSALAAAVADGVLTQEQADAMQARMQARGLGDGTCDHDGVRPMDGSGFHGGGHGRHGGMGGGFLNQGQQP